MDLSPGTLFAGLVVSAVGFSLFLYGKKQARIPQLIGGLLLMVVPLCLPNPWVMSAAGIATIGGVWFAQRQGL